MPCSSVVYQYHVLNPAELFHAISMFIIELKSYI